MSVKVIFLSILCLATVRCGICAINSPSVKVGSDGGDIFESTPKEYPCPQREDIMPCICRLEVTDGEVSRLFLDCTNVVSEEQLQEVFQKDFPVKTFYEFRMNHTSTIKILDADLNGVSFERIYLTPYTLETVTENFLIGSQESLNYFYVDDSRLKSFPFSSLHLFKKLNQIGFSNTSLSSVPKLMSESLTNLSVMLSNLTEILPGTFTDVPRVSYLSLMYNHFSKLQAGTIPITGVGVEYYLNNNHIEIIDEGAFYFTGVPKNDSIKLWLYANEIKKVEERIFKPLMPFIHYLHLEDNPLDCGCDFGWIVTNPDYFHKVYYLATCEDGTYMNHLKPEDYANCTGVSTGQESSSLDK